VLNSLFGFAVNMMRKNRLIAQLCVHNCSAYSEELLGGDHAIPTVKLERSGESNFLLYPKAMIPLTTE
jgi:hypothetical protein